MSDSLGSRASKRQSLATRLYHGETDFNIVGRRKIWFILSGIMVLLSVGSLLTRELHLGIDFEGGVVWEVPAGDSSQSEVEKAIEPFGLANVTIQTQKSESSGSDSWRIEAEPISESKSAEVTAALTDLTGASVDDVNFSSVGATWGKEISEKAVRALVVFLVLVTIYIALRFEMKMAIPTLVALIHDVAITAGVYSITQFEVTPATVIAMLTILGYSIYDGIVVFDKVDENTRLVSSTGGMSYGSMVNLSLNQTLMRSLNTSIAALLPVGSLLVVGSWIMGASALEEFALALLIGLLSGAYSSIFLASPLLALLKEREPRFRDIRRRIEARAESGGAAPKKTARTGASRTAAAAGSGKGSAGGGTATATVDVDPEDDSSEGNGGKRVVSTERVIPPRPRKKSKGRRN